MAYATYSDVQARLPGNTLTAISRPSTTDVIQWLAEADAFLNGALLAAQLTSPATDVQALQILKSWACDYAEGHARMALAAAGGDGSNDDGKDLVAGFKAMLADLRANPALYGEMLQSGSAGDSAERVRSHTTNTTIDLDDTSDGVAPPTFTKELGGDQF